MTIFKNKTQESNKIFLIVNLSCFGDVILTNSLCQNLKIEYPDCKIVFLTDKPYVEAAKYQKNVDDVIYFDKKNNKGIIGLFKFVLSCPYRNKIDASFVIYANDRGIILSKLLNAKRIVSGYKKITGLLLTDYIDNENLISTQDINGNFIKPLTKKSAKILPIKYIPHENEFISKIKHQFYESNIIGLCTVTEYTPKNIPIETTSKIIEILHKENKKIVFLGSGNDARIYADNLKKYGCIDFIDFTNVTSINELACILKMCKGVISIDTGTLHLAYAVGVPVVAVFYLKTWIEKWAPQQSLYKNTTVIDADYSAENICNQLNKLILL